MTEVQDEWLWRIPIPQETTTEEDLASWEPMPVFEDDLVTRSYSFEQGLSRARRDAQRDELDEVDP